MSSKWISRSSTTSRAAQTTPTWRARLLSSPGLAVAPRSTSYPWQGDESGHRRLPKILEQQLFIRAEDRSALADRCAVDCILRECYGSQDDRHFRPIAGRATQLHTPTHVGQVLQHCQRRAIPVLDVPAALLVRRQRRGQAQRKPQPGPSASILAGRQLGDDYAQELHVV